MSLESKLAEELNRRGSRVCEFNEWLQGLPDSDKATVLGMMSNPAVKPSFAVEFLQKHAGYPFRSKDTWSKHSSFHAGSCAICEEKK